MTWDAAKLDALLAEMEAMVNEQTVWSPFGAAINAIYYWMHRLRECRTASESGE